MPHHLEAFGLQVGLFARFLLVDGDHLVDQFFQGGGGRPAQFFTGVGGIPEQGFHFRGAEITGIDAHHDGAGVAAAAGFL